MRIVTLPGVFTPPSDCYLLADTAREHRLTAGANVLDVFTGSGALAISAALDGAASSTAVDVSRRAVMTVRINAALNGVKVRALRGDMVAPVEGEQFDLVLANPPYVPGASDDLPDRGPSRAWEGGVDGRLLVDRFCREVPRVLRPGGSLLMVHSSLTGEQQTLDLLTEAGLEAAVVVRESGGFGKIVTERIDVLERNGVLEPGQRQEDMLVFRATKPA
jgi:release factor glutamine methyltransferase